jgi:hypothetical protein
MTDEILNVLYEHGFPILAAISCGYFIFLILKFILEGVLDNIRELRSTITALKHRTDKISNIVNHIDISISKDLGVSANIAEVRRKD